MKPLRVILVARGRLHRPRANLIQTLHTADALAAREDVSLQLSLPPAPTGFDLAGLLRATGVSTTLPVDATMLLHSAGKGWPFALLRHSQLRSAGVVYTRVPSFALQYARLGIPHVLEVHSIDELIRARQLSPLRSACHHGVLRGLTVISQAGIDALAAHGFPTEALAWLPSGVDTARFGALPVPDRDAFRAPHAAYIGRISHDRGLSLMHALAAHGLPVRLVGPHDDPLPSDASTLTHRPAVAHSEVPALLGESSIALMPYQPTLAHAATISPIKLFEAMAAGRLVIASDLPALREIIRHGENGLLAPPDKPEAWVALIARVRSEPDWAVAMARQARTDAQPFGWDRRAARLLDFCRRRCG